MLASIHGQNSIMWGGSTKPLDKLFTLYIEKAAPEPAQRREAVNKAMEGLGLATDSFLSSVGKWRDPNAASRGAEQQQTYETTEAAFVAALAG